MTEQTLNESTEQTTETTAAVTTEQPQVETQQESTQTPAADTTTEIAKTTEAVGLVKKEETENGDSQSDFNSNLNEMVAAALKGELSDEQKAELDKSGLKDNFEMIVEGHKARQAATDNEIYSVVGGKDSYGELQTWAINNLSEAEVESFNNAVLKSGDVGIAKLAVEALNARYIAKNGSAPSKVIEAGGTVNKEENVPFNNPNEYINETMTHKYRTDPEYAAQVEAKRHKSGF